MCMYIYIYMYMRWARSVTSPASRFAALAGHYRLANY